MTVTEIRKSFFDFFEKKGHQIVPSAPMVVKDDPTLMFINAGMNQFKDFFLGNEIPENRKVANSQKCLRVSGKHNDLDEVGVDTYHHTMFEMLGNWSFGDYFKAEAIEMAWELLTEVYELPKDRLYVTVFEGDKKDGVSVDQESIDLWKKHIDSDRIIKASKKDKEYISKYAKQYPKSEDVAESIVAWIAVRYRLDRISNGNAEIILKTIPNRLKFFDEQNFDMYPLVPRE